MMTVTLCDYKIQEHKPLHDQSVNTQNFNTKRKKQEEMKMEKLATVVVERTNNKKYITK